MCLFFAWVVPMEARPNNFLFADDFLSSNLVNGIFQDSDGMIWVSTENGLNRFDGSKMTTYQHREGDNHSLAHNFVSYVYEDRQGHIFVGSYIGLQLYRPDTDDFTPVACYDDGSELNASPSYLAETLDGSVYTTGNVLCEVKVRDGQPVLLHVKWNGLSDMIGRLHQDKRGTLWCRNSLGEFYRIDSKGTVCSQVVVTDADIIDVLSDEKHNIYVCTDRSDLLRYDEVSGAWIKINATPIARSAIKCVSRLDDNHILVGTDGNGIKTIDEQTGQVSKYMVDLPMVSSDLLKVHQIMRDRDGDLWLALFLKGVAHLRMSQRSFHYLGSQSSAVNVIGANSVSAIMADRKGRLWVGTDGDGAYQLDSQLKPLLHYNEALGRGASPAIVQTLYEDSYGRVWMGSHGEGCGYIRPQDGRYVDRTNTFCREGSAAKRVYAFTEDDHHRLWVATMGNGLFCYDLSRQQVIEELSFDTDINLWQTTLLITSQSQLLVGTYDGVYALSLEADSVKPRRVFDRHIIYALYEDADRQLWAAGPSGLMQFNIAGEILQVVNQHNGLAGNVAYSLQGDSTGTLWVGTNRGLAHYNPLLKQVTNFGDGDGLQGNEFSKNASCCDLEGRLWFGGTCGLNYFFPSQVHTSEVQLRARVTGFYLNNKPINAGTLSGGKPIVSGPVHKAKEFTLLHEDNAFSIELSTVSIAEPGSSRFLYSMNDGPWTMLPHGGRTVSFGALHPGTYVFRYKVVQNKLESPVDEIRITVRPFWWESIWARLIYLTLVLLLIASFFIQMRHHYNVRRQMLIEKHAHQIDEAKLRFFTNITHDIRTPMTLIMSPLQKLIDTDDNEFRQQAYRTMKRNASMLLQLVNQLLDIRKIDNNQMHLHFQKTEIVQLLAEQAEFFSSMADNKHIGFEFRHPDMERLELWVDPGYFSKIVINLLSNAFKYTPNGGQVTLTLTREAKRSDLEVGHVLLQVSDTGIGISAEDKLHIFERFYRASNAYQSADGNGIGLHLTRSLVTLHHGTIEVQDNPEGRGTAFVVRLPEGCAHLQPSEMEVEPAVAAPSITTATLPEQPIEAAPVSPRVQAPRTKYKLLIVDDDVEIRSYLRRELESDFRITECENGEAALKQVFNQKPDIIISDVMMPLMDGLSLCQRIKQNIDLNHIPVILLTAKADQESNIMGLECGADAYVTKPFYIELLRSTVFNLLKSRSALRNNYEGRQNQSEKVESVDLASNDDKLLARIMQAVNKNLSNPKFKVDELGAEVGLSRVHVYRKLKELTNQGPHEFLRNIRLKEAARLLLKGESYSINDIAAAVGFQRPNNFTSAFKEQYGYPPLVWRSMQLAKNNAAEDETPVETVEEETPEEDIAASEK